MVHHVSNEEKKRNLVEIYSNFYIYIYIYIYKQAIYILAVSGHNKKSLCCWKCIIHEILLLYT